MFREMRRKKQQIEKEECINILMNGKRAVLSMNGDNGYPYCIYVNYFYDEKENTIYLHGSKEGHKIDSINRDNKVCFTVCNEGYKKTGDWAYTVTSVVVFGKAHLIDDIEMATQKVRELAFKYYPTKEEVEEEIKSGIKHVQLIAIEVEHMTGKTIHEK